MDDMLQMLMFSNMFGSAQASLPTSGPIGTIGALASIKSQDAMGSTMRLSMAASASTKVTESDIMGRAFASILDGPLKGLSDEKKQAYIDSRQAELTELTSIIKQMH